MNTFRRGVRFSFSLCVVAMLMAVFMTTPASAYGNSKPKVIPDKGDSYANLSVKWWLWAINGRKMADIPYFNIGGPVNISDGQTGDVWFLAGAFVDPNVTDFAVTRTGSVPADKSLFFPLANVVNDYPCPPDWGFEPKPNETLEHFLQRTGKDYIDTWAVPDPSQLFAEVDGVPLTNYKSTSSMFTFTADIALAQTGYDLCVTGDPQPGVSIGYWIWLAPLTPGQHTLHFGVPTARQDITYILTVE
jgi:hypothetical protein